MPRFACWLARNDRKNDIINIMYKPQDHYFKKAKKEGYPARSVYKLKEIDEKFHIFKPGDLVLEDRKSVV